MKFLIVDDSNAIYMIVAEIMRELGHASLRAIDGNDAIEKIKNNLDLDGIFLDWNMPNMNGIEFLKYNYENFLTEVPIIMMTTESSPTYIREALMYGASEYIMKPFSKDIVDSKLNLLKSVA